MNLPFVFINKFHNKEFPIQPPREPWEQHLGEVRQGALKLKFKKKSSSFLSESSNNNNIFIHILKKENQPPGELREHSPGEVRKVEGWNPN